MGKAYSLFNIVMQNKLFQAMAAVIGCFFAYLILVKIIDSGAGRYDEGSGKVITSIARIIFIILAVYIILRIFDIDITRYF